MSALMEGTMRFVSNGQPAGLLQRVATMVAELEAMGVSPVVTVTVAWPSISTPPSNSSVISVGTGTSAPDAGITWSDPESTPQREETPSTPVALDSGESASPVTGNGRKGGGKDFLARKGDGIDWSMLSEEAEWWRQRLESGEKHWRGVPAEVRLELASCAVSSSQGMAQHRFNVTKPKWMPAASSLMQWTFDSKPWVELTGHRQ